MCHEYDLIHWCAMSMTWFIDVPWVWLEMNWHETIEYVWIISRDEKMIHVHCGMAPFHWCVPIAWREKWLNTCDWFHVTWNDSLCVHHFTWRVMIHMCGIHFIWAFICVPWVWGLTWFICVYDSYLFMIHVFMIQKCLWFVCDYNSYVFMIYMCSWFICVYVSYVRHAFHLITHLCAMGMMKHASNEQMSYGVQSLTVSFIGLFCKRDL